MVPVVEQAAAAPAAAPPSERIIVLDTAAFLAGTDSLYSLYGLREVDGKPVQSLAADEEVKFYTTPDVVHEVKDPNARARLKLLEDLITLRLPSKEALSATIAFAKASCDYASLSVTDLRVIALARMLEFERNGTEFLKIEPVTPEFATSRGIPAYVLDEMEEAERKKKEAQLEEEDDWVTVATKKKPNSKEFKKSKKKKKKASSAFAVDVEMQTAATVESQPEPAAETAPVIVDASEKQENSTMTDGDAGADVAMLETEPSPDSGEEGWITPENVELYLEEARKDQEVKPEDERRVGCVTTDFAMQNILMQMGIKILSVDGRRVIRKIRRYVLRCHACGHIERDLERKFCERCGNSSFHRVAFKVSKKGVARVFVNPKRRANLRGTKYSIPMPKGGRHNKDLVLREDQVDADKQRRMQKQKAKLITDVLDPGGFYNAGAKFHNANDRTIVGYGRRNPNESRPGSKSRKR